ncbi:MAG: tRNA 4-thiouridine(8) synthase ThiI [Candidatus Omnitrophica bacterium]|nr:tRNA 4-thiouridine(8) synthase ThiI [Candidatus Omnitrophota bacterium]
MMSGGLDSMLAARIIKDMGIEVIGLNCIMPFSVRDRKASTAGKSLMERFCGDSGIELRKLDISDDFLAMLEKPKFGFGSCLNPCIDCKIIMFRKAKELMTEWGASFLISGEVLGQRPMSQQRKTMRTIDEEAQTQELVLRPLSAKLLDPTLAEKEGWVDREKLYDYSGRSRKAQTDLAVMIGIIEYLQPAGGCLLTDPRFCDRLSDLMKRQKLDADSVALLKLGRHYRIGDTGRLVVGRDERDNTAIEQLALPGDYVFTPPFELPGPTGLGRGIAAETDIALCCRIISRYCDRNGASEATITYKKAGEIEDYTCVASPLPESELEKIRI